MGAGSASIEAGATVPFGNILAGLLAPPDQIAELGARARQHVLETFVGDKHLLRYAQLIEWLVS